MMGQDSNIEWTHHTFNPWMGCAKVSNGCKFCYAENLMDTRYQKVKWGPGGTRVIKKDWREPRKWNRDAGNAGERHRVFCASLADVFEDRDELIEPRGRLFRLIEETTNLDWLLLTKRPQNIMDMVPDSWQKCFPHNVWAGTSVEDQATADERIPYLSRTPVAVRFLSVEPLLGPVALPCTCVSPPPIGLHHHPLCNINYIDWVIVGGESGGKARPCNIDWIRSLVGQCRKSDTSVFVKQLGSKPVSTFAEWNDGYHINGRLMGDVMHWQLNDRKGGDMSEWPEDLRIRELPTYSGAK